MCILVTQNTSDMQSFETCSNPGVSQGVVPRQGVDYNKDRNYGVTAFYAALWLGYFTSVASTDNKKVTVIFKTFVYFSILFFE